MKNIRILVVLFLPFFLFSQETEKRLALVIGNSNYEKGELKNPVNDARLIAKTLDSLNFDVILKENLESQIDLKTAIFEFGNKRPNYDVAFVYYAGHGIQIDGTNFLLPTKQDFISENSVKMFGVNVQDIMDYLNAKTSEVNILILDACRNNPFENNWNSTRSASGVQGLAKIPPPTGSLIAYSTASGQTAADGKGENSLYSKILAEKLLEEDIEIENVFKNVLREFDKMKSDQTPMIESKLIGKLVLKKSNFINEFDNISKLINNENYVESLSLVESVLAKDPGNSRALSFKFDIFLNSKKNDRALRLINNLISQNDASESLLHKRALLYSSIDKLDLALKDYNNAIKLDSLNDENYYKRANFYYNYTENYQYALNDYTRAIEIDSTDVWNYYARAAVFSEIGENDMQIKDLLKCEQIDDDGKFSSDISYFNNLAVSYERGGDMTKALYYYKKHILSQPNDDYGYRNIAHRYYDLSNFEAAEINYTKAVKLDSLNKTNLLARGRFYSLRDEYNKSFKDFSTVVKNHPNDPWAYYYRANLNFKFLKYDKSISDFLRCIELDNEKEIAKQKSLYQEIGEVYEEIGNNEDALIFYKKETEISPDYSWGYFNLGRFFRKIDDTRSAEINYSKAIKIDSLIPDFYSGRGSFYNDKLIDKFKAIEDLTKAIELDPENSYYYWQRAMVYADNDQYQLSIDDYLKCLETDEDDFMVNNFGLFNNLAVTYERIDDIENAIKYYKKETEIKPESYLPYRNLAFRYDQIGDYKSAEYNFTKAIKLDSLRPKSWEVRGNFYSELVNIDFNGLSNEEKYKKAISDYSVAINLEPSNAERYYHRAVVRYSLGTYETAISDYLVSLDLDINNEVASSEYLYNGLAMSYKQLGNIENAIKYLKKEIEISPKSYLGYENLADIHAEQRNFKKAKEVFDLLVLSDTTNIKFLRKRGLFNLESLKDNLNALMDFNKCIELEDNNSYNYYLKAMALNELGQYENSVNFFNKAIELNSEIINQYYVYSHIANCYGELGQNNMAIEYFNKEIENNPNDPWAYYLKAEFHSLKSLDFQKAESAYKKAIELDSIHNNTILSYAAHNYRFGKFDKFNEYTEKAIQSHPKDPQPNYYKAMYFLEQNKKLSALRELEVCISKIIKYSNEYYITNLKNSERLDFSEIFMLRVKIFQDVGELDYLCIDYKNAIKYSSDESIKINLENYTSKNCN